MLNYRQAMAYVLWRWIDHRIPASTVKVIDGVVDEMLSVCPRALQRIASKPYRRKREPRR